MRPATGPETQAGDRRRVLYDAWKNRGVCRVAPGTEEIVRVLNWLAAELAEVQQRLDEVDGRRRSS